MKSKCCDWNTVVGYLGLVLLLFALGGSVGYALSPAFPPAPAHAPKMRNCAFGIVISPHQWQSFWVSCQQAGLTWGGSCVAGCVGIPAVLYFDRRRRLAQFRDERLSKYDGA
jgi:hypothetical protein